MRIAEQALKIVNEGYDVDAKMKGNYKSYADYFNSNYGKDYGKLDVSADSGYYSTDDIDNPMNFSVNGKLYQDTELALIPNGAGVDIAIWDRTHYITVAHCNNVGEFKKFLKNNFLNMVQK